MDTRRNVIKAGKAERKELYAKLHSEKQYSIYLHSRENKSDLNESARHKYCSVQSSDYVAFRSTYERRALSHGVFIRQFVKVVTQERKLVIMPRPQDGSDPNSVLSPITFQNPSKIASNVAEIWVLKCALSGVPCFLFLWMNVSKEKGQAWRHRHR